ncbi:MULTISPECIES: dipeptide ABC transporter ATP-binding protein [unclassified Tolypothrix]|uniref:dipeptide ABC transporter ATP-binding protein n=1 Tax=unclassified Tolypothrix TaxID=2649714 RepID=UPI0005EAB492|nr:MULTISPECIES: ABC transporter ATP-binding protein [unclassified Tolypothrix]BAY93387.1 ABC transporter-like protein [Microchaete diplosiphon NIES-3275]EKE99290.1 putative phosphonate C-P lyase system protein PhnK [Tolypothrix sp. PCC 7601]MBE9082904.1 ABC transporter ATP-binding protein [Tolypothrix sp. LEGE 11397]UYD27238.1 ABC transporter ATP-binding protein [Tolypothrix sp. PCC 7712]UYD36903.1 ABC transporter ATP-binding protein [Tolypothrix sp. PCC 7601]
MSEALFRVENLRVAYPQSSEEELNWAVDDVSFTLQSGERMGLVGESGCGKSTLGRAVMRLLPSSSRIEGNVNFLGKKVFDLTPQEMRKFRGEVVALIFQDPMTRLDPLMTIGNHCIETLQAHSPELSKKQAKEKAIATLEKVKIPASRWNQYPHEFSGGMRQRVAIALALLLNPKLIVADEPTTSLDVTVSAQILQELTRLCAEENMGLLLISHDLAMVAEYCDRIGVMYQGKMVEMGSTESVFRQPQHEYTRSLLQAALHIQAVDDIANEDWALGSEDIPAQNPILKITELKQHYTIEPNFIERIFKAQNQTIKAVDGINLELYPGEILGLVGESGCGKSTLSRTILQLIRPTAGKVEFLGQELTTLSRQEIRSSRRQMQMVFQDPHACLNPAMTVGQSIGDPLLIHNLADATKAKEQVLWMLQKVGLTPPEVYYQRYPSDLSGGQQQRVAIARALITRPKLLICDEPVSMLDASVQSQVLELMLQLKEEFELTYLFITHDLWLARFLCDRIAVMNGGQIVELGPTKRIFANPQHPYTKTLLAAAPLLARA